MSRRAVNSCRQGVWQCLGARFSSSKLMIPSPSADPSAPDRVAHALRHPSGGFLLGQRARKVEVHQGRSEALHVRMGIDEAGVHRLPPEVDRLFGAVGGADLADRPDCDNSVPADRQGGGQRLLFVERIDDTVDEYHGCITGPREHEKKENSGPDDEGRHRNRFFHRPHLCGRQNVLWIRGTQYRYPVAEIPAALQLGGAFPTLHDT